MEVGSLEVFRVKIDAFLKAQGIKGPGDLAWKRRLSEDQSRY